MHRRASLLPILLLTLVAPTPALAVHRLAVLTLTAPWSPDCQGAAWRKDEELRERCPVLETLADEARAGALAALRGRGVDVMTRENTAQLLKAMGASTACTAEGECEVETAKLIGADYVVSGNVTRVERTWLVTLKLHEVESAKLLASSEPIEGATQIAAIKAVRASTRAMVSAGLGDGAVPPVPSAPLASAAAPAPPPATAVVAKPGAVSAAGMVRLPGGTYTTGEVKKTVTVQPFLLDVTEVTVADYGECVKAGQCSADGLTSFWACGAWIRNYGEADRAKHPVNCVDWNQADAYCKAVGKRLPTEEEWEWAARGAEKGTTYPWGNEAPAKQLCWNGSGKDRGWPATCAVGSYPAGDTPQGVKDLAGNVWEWTSSIDGGGRVYRGGGWGDYRRVFLGALIVSTADPASFSAAFRSSNKPTYRYPIIGFRCAKTP